MSKPVLGYWDRRGRAAPIRYLLHYKNVDFEDKHYTLDDSDAWFAGDKFDLGLDFPNLPYYIDGPVKITQTLAILRYLARKYSLRGSTDRQVLRVEQAEQQLVQFRQDMRDLCHDAEFENLKLEFLSNLRGDLRRFDDFLGDSNFVAGVEVTYVDFMAYEVFDSYCYLENNVFKDTPRLEAYYGRIKNLPSIVNYCNSALYIRWPMFSPDAVFGGKGPEPKRNE